MHSILFLYFSNPQVLLRTQLSVAHWQFPLNRMLCHVQYEPHTYYVGILSSLSQSLQAYSTTLQPSSATVLWALLFSLVPMIVRVSLSSVLSLARYKALLLFLLLASHSKSSETYSYNFCCRMRSSQCTSSIISLLLWILQSSSVK